MTEERTSYWKIVSTLVVPVIFIALIPIAVTLGYVQHQSIVRDRKATSIAFNATKTAVWLRYDADIAGCMRGNVIRAHVSNLDTSQIASNQLLGAFLDTSAQFRKASGQDKLAAQASAAREAIRLVASGIEPIAQVKCLAVIKKPSVTRPKEIP